MSDLDDLDADQWDVPRRRGDYDSGCDEMIEEVFSHLGKTFNDEAPMDTDDGS